MMEFSKENLKKLRGLIILTICILVGLWKYDIVLEALGFVFNIIFPFVLGAGFAFVLNVPMNFLERTLFSPKNGRGKILKKLARPMCLLITLLLVISVVGIVVFIVVPQLGTTFARLAGDIQGFVPKVQEWMEELFRNNRDVVKWINSLQFNWEKIVNASVNFFKMGAGSVLDVSFAAAKSIINGVTTFFISFVFACYIVLQKEKLTLQIKKVLYAYLTKEKVEIMLNISALTYKTFSNFLTGQCLEAIILGSLFFIAMGLLKLPYAMLVGILIAFTALIPIFGAFIGCAVGAFLILMVNPTQALIFVVLFLVIQQVEGNLIYPHVVGGSIGLPSIWVLVAVSVGASLMGIVGMLLFIPFTSVIYILFRGIVYAKLEEKEIQL